MSNEKENQNEINIRVCKFCKEPRKRIYDGKFPNGKNKRWRDESGKQWVGDTCGICNLNRSKENMKKKRHRY